MNSQLPPRIHLTATNLLIRYSDLVAIDIPDVAVSGQTIALLGHNGAGKSTLIKGILGLLDFYRGSLVLSDQDNNVLVPEEHMAFCPENGAVFADVVVERYLELWCRIKHRDGNYYKNKGARYLERLDIAPLLRKRGRELSKGQRRRVQTALGFMSDPKLFLFDEPFDGLDVQRTTELMNIVREEKAHRTFLISSHRMHVMERVADAILVLKNGEVASSGGITHVCKDLYSGALPTDGYNLTDAMTHHLQKMAV